MRARAIIFSAPSVRAILEGRKTQTRRELVLPGWADPGCEIVFDGKPGWPHAWSPLECRSAPIACPKGKAKEYLWVRETWYPAFRREGNSNGCVYRADDDGKHLNPGWTPADGWKSSRHMPRWASRLLLRIKTVRVERLQEISEADAKAEGVAPEPCCIAYFHGYSKLWESINGKGSWNLNPYVWVIEFERVEVEEKAA